MCLEETMSSFYTIDMSCEQYGNQALHDVGQFFKKFHSAETKIKNTWMDLLMVV